MEKYVNMKKKIQDNDKMLQHSPDTSNRKQKKSEKTDK